MHGRGHSARTIARELGLARNAVLRYLNSSEAMFPKQRSPRGSKLDSYTEYIDRRLADGLENCVVLLRELRTLGYQGSYRSSRSMCVPAGGDISPKLRCGLRRRQGNKPRSIGAVWPTSASKGSSAD